MEDGRWTGLSDIVGDEIVRVVGPAALLVMTRHYVLVEIGMHVVAVFVIRSIRRVHPDSE